LSNIAIVALQCTVKPLEGLQPFS